MKTASHRVDVVETAVRNARFHSIQNFVNEFRRLSRDLKFCNMSKEKTTASEKKSDFSSAGEVSPSLVRDVCAVAPLF